MEEVCTNRPRHDRRRPIGAGLRAAAAICGIALLAPGIGAATSVTGRIVGRVRLAAPGASRPLTASYVSRAIVAQGRPPREIRNVVVYLQDMPTTAVASRRYELRQEGELFLPHVLAVARGATVDFVNADGFYHNVFSLSRAGTFDLGRFPRGQTRDRKFDSAGLVKVFCHIHSDMSAVIMVFDHPWFTTVGEDGEFVLNDVPAGRRKVTAWHERIGEAQPRTLDVPPGGEVTVEFALPVMEP